MMKSLLHAKVAFFDKNPSGRILTRLSKDLAVGFNVLPLISTWFLDVLASTIASVVVLCLVLPWAMIVVAIAGIFVFIIRCKFMKVSSEAMSFNLRSRGPITTAISSSLLGLPDIRAYSKIDHFLNKYSCLVDQNARAFKTYHLVARALGFYLDALSVFVVVIASFLAFSTTTDPILIALALQLTNSLIGTF